jgi:hypothetical protein
MPDDRDALSPATAEDLALVDALAFALRVQGRKRVHNADELGIRSGAVCAPARFFPACPHRPIMFSEKSACR